MKKHSWRQIKKSHEFRIRKRRNAGDGHLPKAASWPNIAKIDAIASWLSYSRLASNGLQISLWKKVRVFNSRICIGPEQKSSLRILWIILSFRLPTSLNQANTGYMKLALTISSFALLPHLCLKCPPFHLRSTKIQFHGHFSSNIEWSAARRALFLPAMSTFWSAHAWLACSRASLAYGIPKRWTTIWKRFPFCTISRSISLWSSTNRFTFNIS